MPALVLFDVDGTLFLTDDPLFGEALSWATEQVYAIRLTQNAVDRRDNAGQTTLKILGELTGKDERLVECCERTSERYLQLLADADTSGWEAAPRARETLEQLRDRADIALLTGNPEPVARARMERLALDGIFPQARVPSAASASTGPT